MPVVCRLNMLLKLNMLSQTVKRLYVNSSRSSFKLTERNLVLLLSLSDYGNFCKHRPLCLAYPIYVNYSALPATNCSKNLLFWFALPFGWSWETEIQFIYSYISFLSASASTSRFLWFKALQSKSQVQWLKKDWYCMCVGVCVSVCIVERCLKSCEWPVCRSVCLSFCLSV